jgi:hypothetical protein
MKVFIVTCSAATQLCGRKPNKASILTTDPLRVQPAMTIQPSIQKSKRAIGQAQDDFEVVRNTLPQWARNHQLRNLKRSEGGF